MEFVDLRTQYQAYKSEIDARMKGVLTHGHFIMGPEIAELETQPAGYVGLKHCITVSSGTASLEITLRALEVGPGDEVNTAGILLCFDLPEDVPLPLKLRNNPAPYRALKKPRNQTRKSICKPALTV